MASPEWLEIFDNWSVEEVNAHIAKLKEEISVFSTTQVGSKTYVKDLAELKNQLSSAYRSLKERSGANRGAYILTDFSKL